jgi:phosphatidylglycerol:prolipoprotein diacylglycerol transferase
MNPILITIGGFEIRWYSVLILIGAVVVLVLSETEGERYGFTREFMFNALFWSLLVGIVGARLYYCLFNIDMYKSDPIEILKIWHGGLAIHGGLLFGFITLAMYCKKYKVRLIRVLDFIVVPLLFAQAIGRWGNFFNQEAHGAATTIQALKSLHIPDFIISGMTIDNVVYTPTFLYESIVCFISFIVLLIVRRTKYLKVGTLTGAYLVIYGVLRFFIEMSRTDALMLGGFKVAQIASVIMVIIGLGIFMFNSRKARFDDLYNDMSNMEEIRF